MAKTPNSGPRDTALPDDGQAEPAAAPGTPEPDPIPPEVMPETEARREDEAAPVTAAEEVAEAHGEPEPEELPEAPVDEAPPEDWRASGEPEADTPSSHPLPEPDVPAPAPPAEPARRRPIFFPLLLGGIVAALIGAGAVYYGAETGRLDLGSRDLEQTVSAQADRIATLEAALDDAEGAIGALREREPDLSGVTSEIEAVSSRVDDVAGRVDTLSDEVGTLGDRMATLGDEMAALRDDTTARLEDFDARLNDVETQPIPEAELPDEVVAAYERRMEEMQARLDNRIATLTEEQTARFSAIEERLNAKIAELEAEAETAEAAEAEAEAARRRAEASAALSAIESALDSGAGFTDQLARLTETSDVEVPAALSEVAEDGVPTLSSLRNSFPEAARAALGAATRAAADEGSVDAFTAFLRTQLGVRSLEPREGDDPDAVLSRAEAALDEGDLDTTLAEIEALPEAGRAELAGWVERATTRRDAVAAAQALSEQLTSG